MLLKHCHSRHSISVSAHDVNSKTLSSMINLASKVSPSYVLQVGHKMCRSEVFIYVYVCKLSLSDLACLIHDRQDMIFNQDF